MENFHGLKPVAFWEYKLCSYAVLFVLHLDVLFYRLFVDVKPAAYRAFSYFNITNVLFLSKMSIDRSIEYLQWTFVLIMNILINNSVLQKLKRLIRSILVANHE